MANCPVCGSKLPRFENPDRFGPCPTPARHQASSHETGAAKRGRMNKGQKRPRSAANLKKGKKK